MMFFKIDWAPNEILFEVFSLTIYWYSVMFIIAFSLGYYIVQKIYINDNKSVTLVEPLFIYVVFGTLIGARLGEVFFYNWDYFQNNLMIRHKASILTRNDFMYSKMLNINAGLKDGVIKEMAVINHRGLVGRTVDTSINNSKVLLLTDPNSSISVKTISNENHSLLHGSDDGVHLVSAFIKDEKMPKVGDLVVTSGSAQVFPSNILVGKIVKVANDNFHVLPFVDFKKIDYVQVVETK